MDGSSRLSFDPSRLNKASAAEFSSSASEEEDDYVLPGGTDDNDYGDLNPRKRRRVGRNNKERAALGIFGSDSEEDGPGQRWKRKTLRNKGMNFVSSTAEAATGADANGDEPEDEDDSDDYKPILDKGNAPQIENHRNDDDDDDDDDDGGGVGLGFASAAHGLGWTQRDQGNGSQPPHLPFQTKTNFDGTSVLGRGFVPSSASVPVLKEPAEGGTPPPQNKPAPSAFGAKGKINPKSFGARMMAKMGYVEGKGLGKEGQGRNIVIEANLRPQGVGLGAVKEKSEQERQEEKRQARLRGEEVADSEEEEKKRRKAKKKVLGTAGSSAASTPRRQKKKYLTAEEFKAAAPGLNIPEAFTPILDMTGPEGKMLTSTSGVMTPNPGVSESSEVIEARKLARRAQADLSAFSEEWKSLEERKTWLDLELLEREQEMSDLRSDFERLQGFSTLVQEELAQNSDWKQVISCLQKAVELGSINTETADLAVATIHPFLRGTDWDPLANPTRFASDLKQLSSLFTKSGLNNNGLSVSKWETPAAQTEGVYRRHHKATTPYESMMYKCWLPLVLTAVREWDPLAPGSMLDLVESWNDLLPAFVRAQLMDSIARKLEAALSDWNPKKKRQTHHLPHTWLFPWLQYLPPYHLNPKGTGLVADVKRKFRHLIDAWEFERGVVPGLRQWEDVMGDQWQPLIISHVLPSMGLYLRSNFRVDPADQEPYLPILTGVLKWQCLVGGAVMGELLVQDVFPMWYAKLREWLALDDADLGEVAEWYAWWRGSLLQDLSEVKGVSMELDKGLQIMNLV
ncbi:hypothetical protein JDV02_002430 [Purpureocillium takamizusanense]|uniref:G-patch domain-containing protein n=1 Tax=Purpureocillium takamizusanense TaxID=2060973 RepID=A0A9Q8QBK2_9HYPO|nr:uncharacterized protein JDV02_002430 [Purpureocillium takamizusanense]UNI15946.1 hypothetical protein JDV02_002430 [Purpureocillium takamizusanense]